MTTTVKHLARRLGADDRTLRRAVEQGTVRCSRVSPRRVVLTVEEEAYLREHWDLLRRLRAALRTEPNVRVAALFGSTARGDERAQSDVDLLVALDNDSWERRHRLNTRLEQVAGRPVDLIVLARAQRESPALLADALEEGRVIVDREHLWPELKHKTASLRRAARISEARDEEATKAALEELFAA